MEQSGEIGTNRGGMQRTNACATCVDFFFCGMVFFLSLGLSEQLGV